MFDRRGRQETHTDLNSGKFAKRAGAGTGASKTMRWVDCNLQQAVNETVLLQALSTERPCRRLNSISLIS